MRMFRRKKTPHRSSSYFTHHKINVVVKFLTISDILMLTSFGLIAPIFAIFITDHIAGGTVEIAGLASAIFWMTKSISQIPFARFIDQVKGEKDDFWVLVFGSLGITIVPLMYVFVSTPTHLFIVQFFYGLFAAAAFPSWMAIFTRHIDKDKEGLEWGVYQTLIDMGSAASASLGGFLAYRFGFNPLFIVISIFSFFGSLFLLGIYTEMLPGRILEKRAD